MKRWTLWILLLVVGFAGCAGISLPGIGNATPVPAEPQLATAYSGSMGEGGSTSLSLQLKHVTQDAKGDITGVIFISSLEEAGHHFSGVVHRDSSIYFSVQTSSWLMVFTGTIAVDRSMSGTCTLSGAPTHLVWTLSPENMNFVRTYPE